MGEQTVCRRDLNGWPCERRFGHEGECCDDIYGASDADARAEGYAAGVKAAVAVLESETVRHRDAYGRAAALLAITSRQEHEASIRALSAAIDAIRAATRGET